MSKTIQDQPNATTEVVDDRQSTMDRGIEQLPPGLTAIDAPAPGRDPRGLLLGIALLLGALALTLALTRGGGTETATQAPAPAADTAVAETTAPAKPEKATADNWDIEAKRVDPTTQPVAAGPKTFDLVTEEKRVKVGDNVYDLWTFNGTAPGPVLRAVEGDKITINITNAKSAKMYHSVDFHASRLTMGGGHVQVAPGETGTFEFTAEYPGVFMYHCATAPVLEHIGRGMHGMIIIEPKEGYGEPMKEIAVVQHELYADSAAMQRNEPTEMAFNGLPNGYVDEPIKFGADENVRLFYLNAGPSQLASPHVVGTVFDTAFADGNPKNITYGRQALAVPASGGAVFEMTLVDEGMFPLVTHQFNHVAQGAVAMLTTGDGVPGAGKPTPEHDKMSH